MHWHYPFYFLQLLASIGAAVLITLTLPKWIKYKYLFGAILGWVIVEILIAFTWAQLFAEYAQ